MNFSVLSFEEHSIVRAYEILYGAAPAGFLLLNRDDLDRRRHHQTQAANIPGSDVGLAQVEWAHGALCSLLGGRRSAMLSGWCSELFEGVACGLNPTVGQARRAQRRAVTAAVKRSAAATPAKPAAPAVSRLVAPKPAAPAVSKPAAPKPAAPAVSKLAAPKPAAPAQRPSPQPVKATENPDLVETMDEHPSEGMVEKLRARLKSHTMFGRFLLSQGHITLQQLIEAVRWQRAQRPPVGRIAVSWGILSTEQVFELLSAKEPEERFCDLAVSRGYMTRFQRLAVLGRQRQLQLPIGRYFIEQGILSEEQVAELAQTAMQG